MRIGYARVSTADQNSDLQDANLGATDTEVRYFVEDLLDRTFRGEQ